jgi:hypothetical protein
MYLLQASCGRIGEKRQNCYHYNGNNDYKEEREG